MSSQKIILVIGATGAQGIGVINALLAPSSDGAPSPYSVRASTRNVESGRALELKSKGVELVKGSFDDYDLVRAALQGAGGEQKEIYAGMRIFEIAKQTPSMRHYVWSNLDYLLKDGGYDEKYRCGHYDGKGRIGEWPEAQPSDTSPSGLTWSQVTSAPYMELIAYVIFGPLNKRADGTYVFATPAGAGHIPMIALADLGFFARYSFDNCEKVSTKDLRIASDCVDWERLVHTFTKVTGKPAVILHQTFDDWADNSANTELLVANELHGTKEGATATTWRTNFRGLWNSWRDNIIKRDMDWVRSVHPGLLDLESWMKKNNYTGEIKANLLKNGEDGKTVSPRWEKLAQL